MNGGTIRLKRIFASEAVQSFCRWTMTFRWAQWRVSMTLRLISRISDSSPLMVCWCPMADLATEEHGFWGERHPAVV